MSAAAVRRSATMLMRSPVLPRAAAAMSASPLLALRPAALARPPALAPLSSSQTLGQCRPTSTTSSPSPSSSSSTTPPTTTASAAKATPTATTRRPNWDRTPYSRHHFERRIVPFSQRELYDVVANVDDYASFVPWCTASRVTRRVDDHHLLAGLSVGFRLLSDRYTSVITLDPPHAVTADVPHSSLFHYLVTDWTFETVSPRETMLTFYVEFAFRNSLYQRVTDLFFEEVVKQMVSAFENQCHRKYHSKPVKTTDGMQRW